MCAACSRYSSSSSTSASASLLPKACLFSILLVFIPTCLVSALIATAHTLSRCYSCWLAVIRRSRPQRQPQRRQRRRQRQAALPRPLEEEDRRAPLSPLARSIKVVRRRHQSMRRCQYLRRSRTFSSRYSTQYYVQLRWDTYLS